MHLTKDFDLDIITVFTCVRPNVDWNKFSPLFCDTENLESHDICNHDV